MTVAAAPRSDLDLKKFRRKLEAEQARLQDELRRLAQQDRTATGDDATELADYDQHNADQGTELFFREQDEAIAASLKQELGQVELALREIEEGTYGLCDRCGKEIPKERLEVMPWAHYDLQCASEVAI